jgi:lipoyl synthase
VTDGPTAIGRRRKPDWLRTEAPSPRQYRATGALLTELGLSTICSEARCPNKSECFSAGTASFLILGEACTRRCRFCAIGSGPHDRRRHDPGTAAVEPDDEPRRLAEAVRRLGLRHVVITSVTRDDLPDGGACGFAAAIEAIRAAAPGTSVEVLVPDFGGNPTALDGVLAAGPDVLGHNLETVPRLYGLVRPGACYRRSLAILSAATAWAPSPPGSAALGRRSRLLVKTSIMLGLGETAEEVETVLADCAAAGVDAVTIGQYLQPRRACLRVARYVSPVEFELLRRRGERLGLAVQAGPLVRSSYHAQELLTARAGLDARADRLSRSSPRV